MKFIKLIICYTIVLSFMACGGGGGGTGDGQSGSSSISTGDSEITPPQDTITPPQDTTPKLDTSPIDVIPTADLPSDPKIGDVVQLSAFVGGVQPEDMAAVIYQWILFKPMGSAAQLTSDTEQSPSFTMDMKGTYRASITATRNGVISPTKEISVILLNKSPSAVLEALPLQGHIGDEFQLNGGKSHDSDDTNLTYSWIITIEGREVFRSSGLQALIKFKAQERGQHLVTLTVSDPEKSISTASASFLVTNQAPLAKLPVNRINVSDLKQPVSFTGEGEDADHDLLYYHWNIISQPSGSNVTLSNTSSKTTSFSPTHNGSYQIQLVVNDGIENSAPVYLTVAVNVDPPVINAISASKDSVFRNEDVTLGATITSNTLTNHYTWTVIPSDGATLDPMDASCHFKSSKVGTYTISLTVNDGLNNSAPWSRITQITNQSPIISQISIKKLNGKMDELNNFYRDDTIRLEGVVSDPDGDSVVKYNWSVIGPSVSNLAADGIHFDFFAKYSGTYTLRLTIEDNLGGVSNAGEQSLSIIPIYKGISSNDPKRQWKPLAGTYRFSASKLTFDKQGTLYFSGYSTISKLTWDKSFIGVAGNGAAGYGGDGGLAIQATLGSSISKIISDSNNNIFFSDTDNHRIRKIDTQGIISTVVGNGNAGFSGDNVRATDTMLNSPQGLAIDSSGNLYIADKANCRIRKVDLSGNISTVAGNGSCTEDYLNISPTLGTQVVFYNPYTVVYDASSNALYISSYYHLRKLNLATGYISEITDASFSGTGYKLLGGYYDMVANSFGRLIVSVSNAQMGKIQIIDIINNKGTVSDYAGTGAYGFSGDGGPATQAQFRYPGGIALVGDNLYIIDQNNFRLRKVDSNGIINTFLGNYGFSGDGGDARLASLNYPMHAAKDAHGNLFIADSSNQVIRKIDSQGAISTVAGKGGVQQFTADGTLASQASLATPRGVALDAVGTIYIAEADANRIRKIDFNGKLVTIAGNGQVEGGDWGDGGPAKLAKVYYPSDMIFDSQGNLFFVETLSHLVRKINKDGVISIVAGSRSLKSFSGDDGLATLAGLGYPQQIAIDSMNNLYIADSDSKRIRKVDSNGIISTVYGPVSQSIVAVSIDQDDNMFIGLYAQGASEILKKTPNGVVASFASSKDGILNLVSIYIYGRSLFSIEPSIIRESFVPE